ncbi:MAG: aspartate carbamoyltransferase regulatory subunit [Clostridia bacterium]|nr:aspartate carbamoyltransferase regulatory subunit [Clostridia bacterium]
MNVDSIRDGIVIDHIAAGGGMKLYRLLGLESLDVPVALITNVVSSKLGRKDIIKIDAAIPVNFDVIGFVDPGATVNIIRDGILKEKKQMGLPERLVNVLRCKNPRCISSCEQELDQVFRLANPGTKEYRCLYCETKAAGI